MESNYDLLQGSCFSIKEKKTSWRVTKMWNLVWELGAFYLHICLGSGSHQCPPTEFPSGPCFPQKQSMHLHAKQNAKSGVRSH